MAEHIESVKQYHVHWYGLRHIPAFVSMPCAYFCFVLNRMCDLMVLEKYLNY